MSITPLITFKAGICDLDVSGLVFITSYASSL